MDDDALCAACAWSDELARENAPVDLVRLARRVEAEYAGCGLSEFLSESRYENATTRILTTGFDERGGGVRALAEKARRNLYLELNSIDAGSMMYMERAFVSNKTLARVIPIIFAAFDECRTEGRLWSSPVPEDAFEAVRAHYSTLDFLLTRSLVDREANGARTFAFLVNAAYDALRDTESCSESQKTLPGRFFVSDVFDAIVSELARECGLAFVGLQFLDEYTRGQGSRLISLELRSIARYVAACDDANATSAKSTLFALNEGAVTRLISGLDAIHASLVGCRRGRRDDTTAGRVAAGLRNALRRLHDGGCYFASESGVAASLAPRAAREAADASSSQWSSPTTTATRVRVQTPTVASMVLTAALTTAFVAVAALTWTALRASSRRRFAPSTTTFSRLSRARYRKFFDDIDESTERGHVATTTTTKSLSPTMERRRARRSSFCLADAPAIRRRESIDPTVHAHVS